MNLLYIYSKRNDLLEAEYNFRSHTTDVSMETVTSTLEVERSIDFMIAIYFKGGLDHLPPKFELIFVAVITFFPLSSVQILLIPACCLLKMICKKSL